MSGTRSTSVAPDLEPLNVSVQQAADMLGCGRTKFYELLGEGSIRAVRLGKRTLIPVEGLKEFSASLPPAHFEAA